MQLAMLLIIISPYTAFLPLIYMSCRWNAPKGLREWSVVQVSLIALFFMSLVSAWANRSLPSFAGSMGLLFFIGAALYLQQTFTEVEQARKLLLNLWPLTMLAGIFGILQKVLSNETAKEWFLNAFPVFLKGESYTVPITYADRNWLETLFPSLLSFTDRIDATFQHANIAGTWFVFMVLVSIYLWETEKKYRFIYLFGVAVFAVALVFTGSRGAVLGMLASLIAYVLITKNGKLRLTLIAVLVGIALLTTLNPRLSNMVDNRTEIFTESIRLIQERLLTGWGISGAMDQIGVLHSHNIWLGMLLFFGIPGLLFYVVWRGALYRGLIRLYASGSEMAGLLIAAQVFFVVHGIVDITWVTPQGGALFFGLCGVTAGLTKKAPAAVSSLETDVEKEVDEKRRRLHEIDFVER